jgi:hypothetical protein
MHGICSIASSVLWLICSCVQLSDPTGTLHRPLESHGQKATVLLFVAVDCPISNGYAPEINRIIEKYRTRGIDFYLIYGDATVKPADVKKHLADYGFRCPGLLDPQRELVDLLHAKKTPEAVVLSTAGQVLYHGRVDNWYADFGRHRTLATVHDLRDALDAIIAGKSVPTACTDVVGCPI